MGVETVVDMEVADRTGIQEDQRRLVAAAFLGDLEHREAEVRDRRRLGVREVVEAL